MNKTHTDIEGVVEELTSKLDTLLPKMNEKFKGHHFLDVIGLVRTTLQSQADQYEKEKEEMYAQLEIVHTSTMQEMVREILEINNENKKDLIEGVYGHFPAKDKILIGFNRINGIIQKYGVDLSQPNPSNEE